MNKQSLRSSPLAVGLNIITKKSHETEEQGFKFAQKMGSGIPVCLYGDLGSGKTTFAKGFAKGLGISQRIISPTFVIVRQHDLKNGKIFYHIDLYRLENEEELRNIGIKEIFSDKNAIVLVEWAENLGKYKPPKRYDIKFEHLEKGQRKITIEQV